MLIHFFIRTRMTLITMIFYDIFLGLIVSGLPTLLKAIFL